MEILNQETELNIEVLEEKTKELTVKLQTVREENENSQATYNKLLGTHLVNQHRQWEYKMQTILNNSKIKDILQKNKKIEVDIIKLKTFLETGSGNHLQNIQDETCDYICLESSILQHNIQEVNKDIELLEDLITDFQKQINSLTVQINDVQRARQFRLEEINSRINTLKFDISPSQ